MKRDGTPETALEEWLLEMGLGHYYTVISQDNLTRAQSERLAESTLNPEGNAKHAVLFDLLVNQDAITNALDDLETAADYVEQDGNKYDAEMIRECVKTVREELENERLQR